VPCSRRPGLWCAYGEPHLAGHVTIASWPKGGKAWRNGYATTARSSTGVRSWHAGDQAGFPCGPTASSTGSHNRPFTGGDAKFLGVTTPGLNSCRGSGNRHGERKPARGAETGTGSGNRHAISIDDNLLDRLLGKLIASPFRPVPVPAPPFRPRPRSAPFARIVYP